MHREIKFCAKRKSDGEWIYGYIEKLNNQNTFVLHHNGKTDIIDENTIGEYTGLKDKKEKEIYEGNLLHVIDLSEHETLDYISPVQWKDYGWITTEPDGTEVPLFLFDTTKRWVDSITEIEIIGSVHEGEKNNAYIK